MRLRIRQLIETAPMFCAFAMAASGCLAIAYGSVWLLSAGLLAVWLFWRLCGASRRCSVILPLVMLVYGIAAECAVCGIGQSYLRRLPRNGVCQVEMRLCLTDVPFKEGRLGTLPGRSSMTANVMAMRCLGDAELQPAAGKVALFPAMDCQPLPADVAVPGGIVIARGVLRPPPVEPPLEFYPRHLASRGIWRQLAVTEFEALGVDDGIASLCRRALFKLRSRLSLRLIRNIDDDTTAGEVLALGLGLSQFIPADARRRQVASGTVHVFAISGMHLALVVLWTSYAVRWSMLRLHWQWLASGTFALAYVLLTGSAASALRALLMVWTILYARWRLRPPSWLNALGVAGCVGLAARPLAVFDLGFVYSHGVMTVLLMSGPMMARIDACMTEMLKWQPRECRRHFRSSTASRGVQLLFGSALAWLCSCGVALALNPKLTLFAPLYNIPLGVIVSLTLLCCPLRLLFGVLFPQFDCFWASCLSWSMRVMSYVAEAGADGVSCKTVSGYGVLHCVAFQCALALWLVASSASNGAPNGDNI